MIAENNHASCRSHCCAEHGCKYGYGDCPVRTGRVRQHYLCESCSLDMAEIGDEVARRLMELCGQRTPRVDDFREKALEVYTRLLEARAAGAESVALSELGLDLPPLGIPAEGLKAEEDD